MDIEGIIKEIQNINLTQIQIVFIMVIFIITICLTVILVRQTCCKNCVDLNKFDNKFKNQKF